MIHVSVSFISSCFRLFMIDSVTRFDKFRVKLSSLGILVMLNGIFLGIIEIRRNKNYQNLNYIFPLSENFELLPSYHFSVMSHEE